MHCTKMLVLLTNFLKQLCVLLCCLFCVVLCYLFENFMIHFYSYSLQSFYFLTLPINTYCESIHFRLKKKKQTTNLERQRWAQVGTERWSQGRVVEREMIFHFSFACLARAGPGWRQAPAVPSVSSRRLWGLRLQRCPLLPRCVSRWVSAGHGAVRTHWHLHGMLAD